VSAEPVKPEAVPSRRELLRAGAGIALAGAVQHVVAQTRPGTMFPVPGPASMQPASRPSASQPPERPATRPAVAPAEPWWMEGARSRVVDVSSDAVFDRAFVEERTLQQMLDAGVQRLTDERSPEAAWRAILGNARRIAIKMNSVGDAALRTNEPLLRALVQCLRAVDIREPNLTLVEAPIGVPSLLGISTAAEGWQERIRIDNDDELIARWWGEVDAVLNIGLLKSHRLAGFSGVLKNLSHAVVRRPARYHGDRLPICMAGVFGAPVIAQKLRLNILNALRVMKNGGPGAAPEDVVDAGHLVIGSDPVAVDAIGRDLLATLRHPDPFPSPGPDLYLPLLVDRGLGRINWEELDHHAVRV
jgi:hypothetical protein